MGIINQPLRYAILRHEGIDDPHFDLLFETAPGSLLLAFRAACWPIDQSASLERLPDHRRIYLDYEGSISDNRGHVKRIESGTCSIATSTHQWTIHFDNGKTLVIQQATSSDRV
jgi:hypothetical protein